MNTTNYLNARQMVFNNCSTLAGNLKNQLIKLACEKTIQYVLKLNNGEIILFICGSIVVGFIIKTVVTIENQLPPEQQTINIVRKKVNKIKREYAIEKCLLYDVTLLTVKISLAPFYILGKITIDVISLVN